MHSFRSKTHILGISHHFGALKCPFGFAPHTLRLKLVFQVVSRHFIAAPDLSWNCGLFMPPKPFLILSQPIHYFRSKTHVLGGSMPFRSRTWHVAKTGIEVHLMHEFMPLDPFLVFCSKHAQSTTLGLKLMFWMVSCHFVAPRDLLQTFVSGSI